jgi:hypothetical protein
MGEWSFTLLAVSFSKANTAPVRRIRLKGTSGALSLGISFDTKNQITTEHAAHRQTGHANVIGTPQGSFHHNVVAPYSIGGDKSR